MSLFQSGPYQSKAVSYVVQQTQRWVERGQIAWRSLKVGTSWTAQVLLYPIYFGFQTVRLAGTKLQQFIELELPKLRSGGKPPAGQNPVSLSPPTTSTAAITSETPIYQVLQTVQTFSPPLPVALPPTVLAAAKSAPLSGVDQQLASSTSRSAELAGSLSLALEQALVGSQKLWRGLTQKLAQYQTTLLPVAQKLFKGKDQKLAEQTTASLLELPQQAILVAEKPLQVESAALEGLVVAPAANLHTTHPPLSWNQSWNQLLSVSKTLWKGLSQGAAKSQRALLPVAQKLLATLEPKAPSPSLTNATPAFPETSTFIRGVASLLETKLLVLVTSHNQILDLLTAEQQQQLHQRITWEVAHYGRYRQMQLATRRAFARLQPPAPTSHALPLVRTFWQLMAWMQSSSVAIAANLFQEASLASANHFSEQLPVLPSLAQFDFKQLLRLPPAAPQLALAGATEGSTNNLSRHSPQKTSLLPASPFAFQAPTFQDIFSKLVSSDSSVLDLLNSPQLSPPPVNQEEPESCIQSASNQQPASQSSPEVATATIPPASILSQPIFSQNQNVTHTPTYLEVRAIFMGYVQSPLEKLIRGIDRALLWLEDWLEPLPEKLKPWLDQCLVWLENWLASVRQYISQKF